ncbi:alpha/beta fold hydrolase [Kocuria sp. NPDC057446]|uniref:alpha/beta hydrolase family protein n=1 Tax=Kocuria sp. NPDC057446 TaxID=3346137 RepID=UPI0036D11EAB
MDVPATVASHSVEVLCQDGFTLRGRLWDPAPGTQRVEATVVIAAATGVKSAYYHRYARFLAESGLSSFTVDYRGIGDSKQPFATARRARWADWGVLDLDAALRWVMEHRPEDKLLSVGHSFGGFGIGLAAHSRHVHRHLSVGGQHAYWRDYRPGHRAHLWWRWHMLMPMITAAWGHFPGSRLGWLEDLPRGVAMDWARSKGNFTATGRTAEQRGKMQEHLAHFCAPTLAVTTTDDPYATPAALSRALSYSPLAHPHLWELRPEDLGVPEVGHFGLFHDRFRTTFWPATLAWLRDGTLPLSDGAEPTAAGPQC